MQREGTHLTTPPVDPILPLMRSANCMYKPMILQALAYAVSVGIEDRGASIHNCGIRYAESIGLPPV